VKFPKKYPAWFPYPSSWLRSLALLLIGFPLLQVILFGYFLLVSTFFVKAPLSLIVLAGVGLALVITLLSYIYYLVWYKKHSKSSMRVFGSIWEGLFATFVLLCSFALLLGILFPLIQAQCSFTFSDSQSAETCLFRQMGGIVGQLVKQSIFIWDTQSNSGIVTIDDDKNWSIKPWIVIWLIIVAYIYQLEYFIARKFLLKLDLSSLKPILEHRIFKYNKNLDQSKNKDIKIKSKQDEIDDELEVLKKEINLDK
jgi:hypothetical protein